MLDEVRFTFKAISNIPIYLNLEGYSIATLRVGVSLVIVGETVG